MEGDDVSSAWTQNELVKEWCRAGPEEFVIDLRDLQSITGHKIFQNLSDKLEPEEKDVTYKVTEDGVKNRKTYMLQKQCAVYLLAKCQTPQANLLKKRLLKVPSVKASGTTTLQLTNGGDLLVTTGSQEIQDPKAVAQLRELFLFMEDERRKTIDMEVALKEQLAKKEAVIKEELAKKVALLETEEARKREEFKQETVEMESEAVESKKELVAAETEAAVKNLPYVTTKLEGDRQVQINIEKSHRIMASHLVKDFLEHYRNRGDINLLQPKTEGGGGYNNFLDRMDSSWYTNTPTHTDHKELSELFRGFVCCLQTLYDMYHHWHKANLPNQPMSMPGFVCELESWGYPVNERPVIRKQVGRDGKPLAIKPAAKKHKPGDDTEYTYCNNGYLNVSEAGIVKGVGIVLYWFKGVPKQPLRKAVCRCEIGRPVFSIVGSHFAGNESTPCAHCVRAPWLPSPFSTGF